MRRRAQQQHSSRAKTQIGAHLNCKHKAALLSALLLLDDNNDGLNLNKPFTSATEKNKGERRKEKASQAEIVEMEIKAC